MEFLANTSNNSVLLHITLEDIQCLTMTWRQKHLVRNHRSAQFLGVSVGIMGLYKVFYL